MFKPVHYTSHACLVANPGAGHPKPTWRAVDEPTWIACQSWGARPLKAARHLYSTRIAHVTCVRCVEAYDRRVMLEPQLRQLQGPDAPETSPLDRELLAHRDCCSRRGAALMADPAALAELERQRAHAKLRKDLESLDVDVVCVLLGAANGRVGDPGEAFRHKLSGVVQKLPEPVRGELRPAIDEYTMVSDLLSEIGRMQAAARRTVEELLERVRTDEREAVAA